jgi:hypothetical protein
MSKIFKKYWYIFVIFILLASLIYKELETKTFNSKSFYNNCIIQGAINNKVFDRAGANSVALVCERVSILKPTEWISKKGNIWNE